MLTPTYSGRAGDMRLLPEHNVNQHLRNGRLTASVSLPVHYTFFSNTHVHIEGMKHKQNKIDNKMNDTSAHSAA